MTVEYGVSLVHSVYIVDLSPAEKRPASHSFSMAWRGPRIGPLPAKFWAYGKHNGPPRGLRTVDGFRQRHGAAIGPWHSRVSMQDL